MLVDVSSQIYTPSSASMPHASSKVVICKQCTEACLLAFVLYRELFYHADRRCKNIHSSNKMLILPAASLCDHLQEAQENLTHPADNLHQIQTQLHQQKPHTVIKNDVKCNAQVTNLLPELG